MKRVSTRIPGIVFHVLVEYREPGNQAGKPAPARSALTSFRTRSLPGAFLISHCRRSSCLLLREQHRTHDKKSPRPLSPFPHLHPILLATLHYEHFCRMPNDVISPFTHRDVAIAVISYLFLYAFFYPALFIISLISLRTDGLNVFDGYFELFSAIADFSA